MALVTPHSPYPQIEFAEVEHCGFIYLGMTIDPPRRVPFVRRSAQRDQAIAELITIARQLESHPEVLTAQVYRAILIPPIKGGPRFDAAMLIRTTSPDTIAQVEATEAYQRLNPAFRMAARNIRRIGDTDTIPSARFLFNHFTAPDPDDAVAAWEHVGRWFTAETGVDNSTLLRPINDEGSYAIVNYVRLPRGPIWFVLNQLTKRTFRSYVLRHLRSKHIEAMPVFFTRV